MANDKSRSSSANEPAAGPGAKVTLLIGSDTLEKLDKIVKRGHFGGRGRALDALLDALDNLADEGGDWYEAFNRMIDKKSDNKMIEQAENEMIAHAIKTWEILDRFVKLETEW